eukprot:10541871-Ditylum_brightwellii.AAC.1
MSAKIAVQSAHVRTLKKKSAASADDIASAVEELKKLKFSHEELASKHASGSDEAEFPRRSFDDLILRKMFVVPSFEIHGGVK